MKFFLRKLAKYGYRRALIVVFLKIIQTTRITLYRYILSDNKPHITTVKFFQPTQFVGQGSIYLNKCQIGVWPSPGFLNGYGYLEARNKNANITIGENTYINNNAVIIAEKGNIEIGCRCLIGHGFLCFDSDFHGLKINNRLNGTHKTDDVKIGDDVFIGVNVKVLKGVTIGSGSVIGSATLVASNVPENVVVGGIPAKIISNLD